MSIGKSSAAVAMLLLNLSLAGFVLATPDEQFVDRGVVKDVDDGRSLLVADLKPIVAASIMMRADVVDQGRQKIGRVVDLVIDPRMAKVSLVLVEAVSLPRTLPTDVLDQARAVRRAEGDRDQTIAQLPRQRDLLAFPCEAFAERLDDHGRLMLLGDRADGVLIDPEQASKPFTRRWLDEQFLVRQDRASWQEAQRDPPHTVRGPGGDYRLQRYSALQGREIGDAAGTPLARVVDAGVTLRNRRLPYIVIQLTAGPTGRLVAVPLAAFVSITGEPWRLGVPRDRLADLPKFRRDHWPTVLDHRWSDLVRKPPLQNPGDGVQVRAAGATELTAPGTDARGAVSDDASS